MSAAHAKLAKGQAAKAARALHELEASVMTADAHATTIHGSEGWLETRLQQFAEDILDITEPNAAVAQAALQRRVQAFGEKLMADVADGSIWETKGE